MKIAATEAQWDTGQPCRSRSSRSAASPTDDQTPSFSIQIPRLLSFLATGSFDGKVVGLNELQTSSTRQQYGPGNYIPTSRVDLLEHAGDGLRWAC